MSSSCGSSLFEIAFFIREAKNLENRKLIGNNAPFVQVIMGNQTKRTSSYGSLDNPKWNEKLSFCFNKWEELPDYCLIQVKDENTLLPNPLLGEFRLQFDRNSLLNYNQPEFILQDGFIKLENIGQGMLDFQALIKYNNYNQFESKNEKMVQNENMIQNENMVQNQNMVQNESNFIKETYVLPTIHVKDKPNIIEKEVEYNKPIEIKETIIHKEKPIIIEQPIIKEKNEQYQEEVKFEQQHNVIKKTKIHEQDVGNLDKEVLSNLREQRQQEFNDTTPNIQYEKQQINLDKEYHEKPTQIKEKQVEYQQPIEIEKTNIEKVKPIINEDVTVKKEHVYQKLAPEIRQDEPELRTQ